MKSFSFTKFIVDIKKFSQVSRIKKGGFGVVYKVQDKETAEIYAAKVIDCDDNEDQCKEIADREIGIMLYTYHPTIIKFIGYSLKDFQGENNVTIIMQLAENGSLSDVLHKIQFNNEPIGYSNTSRQIILVGVARGMKYLHNRNIIHRDLKPGNILLDKDFHPLITDFGLSKYFMMGHSKSQSNTYDTLSYMAPEVVRNLPYDKKADVYSFGILMFEILTDSQAYPELENGKVTASEFRIKVVNENYRPKFEFPIKKSLQNLIEQCLMDDPNKRPTFDEIFNKLSGKKGNENDEYLLEDVEKDELELYIDDINQINDPFEALLDKVEKIEEQNNQLKEEKQKLTELIQLQKEDNQLLVEEVQNKTDEKSKMFEIIEQQIDDIQKLKEKNDQIENTLLKQAENNQQLQEIIKQKEDEYKHQFEENLQLKKDIQQLKDENKKLQSENESIKKQIEDHFHSLKSDLVKNNNDLKIIKILGNGTLGEVFLLENSKTNEKIVLKTIYNSLLSNKEKVAGIFDELSKLSNPAILKIKFNKVKFLYETYPKIETDYMTKGSLIQNIQHFTNTTKFINLLGIALGMHYLHSHNILHLNLKPENILLDDNFYPQISDFGIKKITNNGIFKNETLFFTSPEILEGKEGDSKADVYSYSLIAYYIITGKYPTCEGSLFMFMQNIIKGKRPNLSCISNNGIKSFLKSCWSRNPEDRPSFEQIVRILCNENFYSCFQINFSDITNYLSNCPNIFDCFAKDRYKLIVLGSTACGKTSIIYTYSTKKILSSFIPTCANTFSEHKIKTKIGEAEIMLWDTNTNVSYVSLLEILFRDTDAILFVADVSEGNIYQDYIEDIQKYIYNKNDCLIYITAHKIDMKMDEITIGEIKNYADKHHFKMFQTSCHSIESIDTMFETIAYDLIHKYKYDFKYISKYVSKKKE